ncbi:MAG: ribokinase [Cyanothece sp. SIO1E1]|nr:ribokinase [Cyanothece sp. SIO1E1]
MPVIIFGSLNMDLVTRTPCLPIAGETLVGYDFTTVPGGKGANQAVAIARLGVAAQMVGRVGGDSFGQELLLSLQAAGVQTDGVFVDAASHSGVAAIAVDEAGENHIIVVAGANGQVNQTDLSCLNQHLSHANALLLQLEIPLSAVQQAAQMASLAGVTVILDPAPARSDLPDDFYPLIDIITPNQIEAGQLVGFTVNSPETAAKAAAVLRQRGVKTVIVKLGQQGALCVNADATWHIPAFPVQAVDTVAAGDAFNGGLAAALAKGLPLRQAVIWGSAAGALAVTKAGAQPAMPDLEMLMDFMAGVTDFGTDVADG